MLAPIINANIPGLQVTVAYLGTDFADNDLWDGVYRR